MHQSSPPAPHQSHLHFQHHTLTLASITISTINTTPLLQHQSPSPPSTPHPYSYVNHHLTINTTPLLQRQSPYPLSTTTPLLLRQSPSPLSTPHPYSYVNHHLHYQHHTLTPTSITNSYINTTPLPPASIPQSHR